MNQRPRINSLRNRRQSVDISKNNRFSFQLIPYDNREVLKKQNSLIFKKCKIIADVIQFVQMTIQRVQSNNAQAMLKMIRTHLQELMEISIQDNESILQKLQKINHVLKQQKVEVLKKPQQKLFKRCLLIVNITLKEFYLFLQQDFKTQRYLFLNRVLEIIKQKKLAIIEDKYSVCRICDKKVSAESIKGHSDICLEKVNQKKNLVDLNIQLVKIAEDAYKKKHDFQVKLGVKQMKQIKNKPIKDIQDPIFKLSDHEIMQINSAMNMIYTYAEKIFNQPNAEDLKGIDFLMTKVNIITLSEFNNAQESISLPEAKEIIDQAICIIEDRIDHFRKMQIIEQRESDQQVQQLKKSFTNKSMSSRQFKISNSLGQRNTASPQRTNQIINKMKSSGFKKRGSQMGDQVTNAQSPNLREQLQKFSSFHQQNKEMSQISEDVVSESESNSSEKDKVGSGSEQGRVGSILLTDVIEEESNQEIRVNVPNYDAQFLIVKEKGYNSDSEVVTFNAQKEETNISIQDFEFIKPLGQGAFGGVFLARKKITRDLYAIKIIDCSNQDFESLKAERNIFEILTGDFVVKAYYSFIHDHYLCFVQEYMVGGDFANILKLYTALDEMYVQYYIAEIILALEILRQNNIVHRDLKPNNILLDSNGHAKLADFGLSQQGFNKKLKNNLGNSTNLGGSTNIQNIMNVVTIEQPVNIITEYQLQQVISRRGSFENKHQDQQKIVGTPDYISPEMLNQISTDNFSTDYWSLGVIIYEMLTGIPPFNDESVEQIFDNIRNMRIEWPEIGDGEDCISPNAADLIKQLLNPDYQDRIGHKDINEIKQHPFFKGIKWDTIRKYPGLIVPKMILPQQTQNQSEKVEQFLKNLNKTDKKYSQIAQNLKKELQNFERVDLLQQKTIEEANFKLLQNKKQLKTIEEEYIKIHQLLEMTNVQIRDLD